MRTRCDAHVALLQFPRTTHRKNCLVAVSREQPLFSCLDSPIGEVGQSAEAHVGVLG